jgi:hypothetical protein
MVYFMNLYGKRCGNKEQPNRDHYAEVKDL